MGRAHARPSGTAGTLPGSGRPRLRTRPTGRIHPLVDRCREPLDSHQLGTPRAGLRTAALRGALHLGAAALPRHVRNRWRQDWDGELYACATLTDRLTYVRDVLLGIPLIALETRRTERRRPPSCCSQVSSSSGSAHSPLPQPPSSTPHAPPRGARSRLSGDGTANNTGGEVEATVSIPQPLVSSVTQQRGTRPSGLPRPSSTSFPVGTATSPHPERRCQHHDSRSEVASFSTRTTASEADPATTGAPI